MKCTRCNQELQSGWNACPACGQKIAQNHICPNCGREVDLSFRFCPFCGKATTVQKTTTAKTERQVDRVDIYDFFYECGLDADEADKKASRLVAKLTEEEFTFLKDAYQWVFETFYGEDTDYCLEALQKAEQLSIAIAPEQFPLAQTIFEWAMDSVWANDSDLNDEALELTIELLQIPAFDETRLELFKAVYDWFYDEVHGSAYEFIDDSLNFAKELIQIPAFDEARLEQFKEIYDWVYDEVHGSAYEFINDSLALAKELIPRMTPNIFEKLKQSYSKAVDDLEKEPEDALAYARKRIGI
ncbi:MAG: zinc ribbon domain-containing protein [Thermodesulfobacteriota bacterium]